MPGMGHDMGSVNMSMPGMDHGGMDMGSMPGMEHGGMPGMSMDLNDIEYDAYLANDRTLDDPEVIRVEKGSGDPPASSTAPPGRPSPSTSAPSRGRWWLWTAASWRWLYFPDDHGPAAGYPPARAVGGRCLPHPGAAQGAPQRTGIVIATAGAAVSKLPPVGEAGPVLDFAHEAGLRAIAPLAEREADVRASSILYRRHGGLQLGDAPATRRSG